MTSPRRSIAIVTATFPPYRGGMGRVAQLDAEQLAAAGFEAHVYAPGIVEQEHPEGYVTHALQPWFRYGNAAFAPELAEITRKHELTLLHYPFFGGAEPLVLGMKPDAGKLVVVYHMDVVGKGLFRAIFAIHRRLLLPRIMAAADRVIVTSLDYARTSAIASVVAKRSRDVIAVPPSVDAARFSPGEADTRVLDRYRVDPMRPVVMFTGGLDRAHYFKGVDRLLAAMAMPALAKAQLVIVGKGGLRPRYEADAVRLGLADRVHFAGGASDEDVVQLLRAASVFAFPSVDRSEAFGIAALEALSCGVPVVASDLPGVRTIVQHGRTGFLIPPGHVESLAARLADVINDPALQQRMGADARALVLGGYTPVVRTRLLADAVSQLL